MRRTTVTVLAVLLSVVFLPGTAAAGGGGGACQAADPREAMGDTVSMNHSCFEPNILRTEPGTTVTFVNSDILPHRVLGLGMGFGSMQILQQGGAVKATFTQPGIYPYVCDLHPGMLGAVVVGDGLVPQDAGPADAADEGRAAAQRSLAAGGDSADSESAMGLPRTLPAGLAALVLVAAAVLLARRRTTAHPPQA